MAEIDEMKLSRDYYIYFSMKFQNYIYQVNMHYYVNSLYSDRGGPKEPISVLVNFY